MKNMEDHFEPEGNILIHTCENMKDPDVITTEVVEGVNEGVCHMFISGAFKLDGEQAVKNFNVLPPVQDNLKNVLLPRLKSKLYVTYLLEEKFNLPVHPKTVKKCFI